MCRQRYQSSQLHCVATRLGTEKSMTDANVQELMAVVGMANETNKMVTGYQVEVDSSSRHARCRFPSMEKAARTDPQIERASMRRLNKGLSPGQAPRPALRLQVIFAGGQKLHHRPSSNS